MLWLQDGIKLFTYSFYKQRRSDVQVCAACLIDKHIRHINGISLQLHLYDQLND